MVAGLAIALQLICAAVLATVTYLDIIAIGWLFAIAVLLGIARAFAGPALSALAPNLVPKKLLPTAIGQASIAWQTGMIVGPALGGVLYEIAPALPYAAAAGLFVLALIGLMAIGRVPRSKIAGSRHPIRQIRDGLAYVGQNRMVLSTITLDLFAVFLAGATALFPIYARDILQVGETGLAQLAMAPAIGATTIAAVFSIWPLKANVGPRMLWAVFVFGLATIGFGFSTSMPLSLALLFVVGAADMFSVYIRQSLIQLHTPDEKRGRVSAVSQLTISASNEGGDFFSGTLASIIGPVGAVVSGGIGAIVVVAAYSRLFPVLRQTRTFDPPDALVEKDTNEHLQERPS